MKWCVYDALDILANLIGMHFNAVKIVMIHFFFLSMQWNLQQELRATDPMYDASDFREWILRRDAFDLSVHLVTDRDSLA